MDPLLGEEMGKSPMSSDDVCAALSHSQFLVSFINSDINNKKHLRMYCYYISAKLTIAHLTQSLANMSRFNSE